MTSQGGAWTPRRIDQRQSGTQAGMLPAPSSNILQGKIIIIPGPYGGLFVYYPAPGPGNLIMAITAGAGIDPISGQAYSRGITLYNQPQTPTTSFAMYTGNATEQEHSWIFPYVSGSSPSERIASAWIGPQSTGAVNALAAVGLFSAAADGSELANGTLIAYNLSGTEIIQAIWDYTGFYLGGVEGELLHAFITPSGDTTGETDASNINRALSNGWPVTLTAGTYYVNATLEIPGNGALLGPTGTQYGTTVIEQVSGANLNAVIASSGWLENTNTESVSPVMIRDIYVNANSSGQTAGDGHGLVLQSYASHVQNVTVLNAGGDAFRIDFYGQNGTTGITNTCVENRFEDCKAITPGGSCFNTTDPTSTSAITDGFLINFIAEATGTNDAKCVNISASAGWLVQGCHIYGLGGGGLYITRPDNTRIIGNLVEMFGESTTGAYYYGIVAGNGQEPEGVIIMGNTVEITQAPGSSSSHLFAIQAAGAADLTFGATIVGNNVYCASAGNTGSAGTFGIYVQGNTGGTVNVVHTGNSINGTWTETYATDANGGTINDNGAGS